MWTQALVLARPWALLGEAEPSHRFGWIDLFASGFAPYLALINAPPSISYRPGPSGQSRRFAAGFGFGVPRFGKRNPEIRQPTAAGVRLQSK